VNAVWTYERPFEAVVLIAGYIAFYPDRVDEFGEITGSLVSESAKRLPVGRVK